MKEIEVPYELPVGWEWARIASATKNITAGGDKPKEVSSEKTNDFQIPIYSNGIKDNGLYGWAKEAKVFEPSVTVSARGTIGFTAIRNHPFVPIVRLISVTPLEKTVDVSFLKYMLSHLIPTGEGTSIPQLTVPGLKPFLIALPPYHEQLKIVQSIKSYLKLIDEIDNNQLELNNITVQLKQKVLDVAMQGKLVPQDPNDEPASVLLEKIRAEKLKLFEEGKLKKKDLVETEIVKGDDNAYYEKLPVGWVKTSLGNIVYLLSGRDLATADYSDSLTTGIPYITGASNFNNGIIQTSRFTEVPQVISEKDDLLITVKGTVGELAFNPFNEAHIARQIMAARPYQLDKEFLMVYLESRIDNMKSQAQSIIPGISRDVLLKMPVDLPPKNEQHRITSQIRKTLQEFDTIC
ncbi:TPA: restriction endonuclease subunit S [Enterococcus faecalis]|nr:restriction endonuclease subunit S [Enterococcus faecalis]